MALANSVKQPLDLPMSENVQARHFLWWYLREFRGEF